MSNMVPKSSSSADQHVAPLGDLGIDPGQVARSVVLTEPERCGYCGVLARAFYSFNPTAMPDMCGECVRAAAGEPPKDDRGIDPGLTERMSCLAEELGETIQVLGKILRHGIDSDNNGEMPLTNRDLLVKEWSDALAVVTLMRCACDFAGPDLNLALQKLGRLRKWTHHQPAELFEQADTALRAVNQHADALATLQSQSQEHEDAHRTNVRPLPTGDSLDAASVPILQYEWQVCGAAIQTGTNSATNTGDEVRAHTLVARHNEIVVAMKADLATLRAQVEKLKKEKEERS